MDDDHPGAATDRAPAPGITENELRYTAFYRESFYQVAKFVMRATGADLTEAIDSTQEAFTQAWQNWCAITNPHAWIRTVAMRVYWRSVPRVEQPSAALPDAGTLETPETVVQLGESARFVQDVLATLPPKQRIVMAYTLAGACDDEIALAIKSTRPAVRQNRARAREALRRHVLLREGRRSR